MSKIVVVNNLTIDATRSAPSSWADTWPAPVPSCWGGAPGVVIATYRPVTDEGKAR